MNGTPTKEIKAGRGGPGKKRRPGGGRKSKAASAYTVQLNVSVSDSADAALRAWAEMESRETGERVERTDIARRAIDAWLLEKSFV